MASPHQTESKTLPKAAKALIPQELDPKRVVQDRQHQGLPGLLALTHGAILPSAPKGSHDLKALAFGLEVCHDLG